MSSALLSCAKKVSEGEGKGPSCKKKKWVVLEKNCCYLEPSVSSDVLALLYF